MAKRLPSHVNLTESEQDDYRLIVPSLRGFGKSTHPGNVRSSGTLFDIVNDLDCILRHAGVEKAVCMGCVIRIMLPTLIYRLTNRHDWGSQICYEAARSRPDITTAVIGVAIPVSSASFRQLIDDRLSLLFSIFLPALPLRPFLNSPHTFLN